ELQPGAIAGRLQHDDLGAGAGNAADRVQELALDERPALDLQAQRHEEGGHDVEICDREADVVEAPYMCHGPVLPSSHRPCTRHGRHSQYLPLRDLPKRTLSAACGRAHRRSSWLFTRGRTAEKV